MKRTRMRKHGVTEHLKKTKTKKNRESVYRERSKDLEKLRTRQKLIKFERKKERNQRYVETKEESK